MKFGNCRGIKSMKFFGLPKVMAITVTQNDGLERLELALEASNLYYLCIDQGLSPELLSNAWKFICTLEIVFIRGLFFSCNIIYWLEFLRVELVYLRYV